MYACRTSQHSSHRMQQRGIPTLIIDWLIAYGETEHDHRGCEIHYFNKRSRRQMERDLGQQVIRRLHDYLNAYVVMATDGGIVTVGHRTRRINRH